MTDREKLKQAYEAVVDSMITGTGVVKCVVNPYGDTGAGWIDPKLFYATTWQPTNRACFDKPAGVPILHGETL